MAALVERREDLRRNIIDARCAFAARLSHKPSVNRGVCSDYLRGPAVKLRYLVQVILQEIMAHNRHYRFRVKLDSLDR